MSTEERTSLIIRFFEQDVNEAEKEMVKRLIREDAEFLKEWQEYRQILLTMDLVPGFERYGINHFPEKSKTRLNQSHSINQSVLFSLLISVVIILGFVFMRFSNFQYLSFNNISMQDKRTINQVNLDDRTKSNTSLYGIDLRGSQLKTEGGISKRVEENIIRNLRTQDDITSSNGSVAYSSIPLYTIHYSDTVYTEFKIFWENKYQKGSYILEILNDKARLVDEFIINTSDKICTKTVKLNTQKIPKGDYTWILYYQNNNTSKNSKKVIQNGSFYITTP